MDREKFTLTLYFAFEWQKSGNFRRKSDFHSYFHHFSLFASGLVFFLFLFSFGSDVRSCVIQRNGHNSDWLTHLLRQAISARLCTAPSR